MFQFPPLASPTRRVGDLPARSCRKGVPHSETRGSTLVCSFPRLFAALRVLPRLTMPRHPPCALLMLTLYGLHGKPSSMTLDLLPPGVWVCMRLRPHPPWRRATRPRTHNLLVWMCCMCMCYESISFTTSKNSKKICPETFRLWDRRSGSADRPRPAALRNRPSRRQTLWSYGESNPGPPACKAGALAS